MESLEKEVLKRAIEGDLESVPKTLSASAWAEASRTMTPSSFYTLHMAVETQRLLSLIREIGTPLGEDYRGEYFLLPNIEPFAHVLGDLRDSIMYACILKQGSGVLATSYLGEEKGEIWSSTIYGLGIGGLGVGPTQYPEVSKAPVPYREADDGLPVIASQMSKLFEALGFL